jgi:hypothetical protein
MLLQKVPFTLRYPGRFLPASGWLAPPQAGKLQGERATCGLIISFSLRGERFDFAHRPEQVKGVSNHERDEFFWLLTRSLFSR